MPRSSLLLASFLASTSIAGDVPSNVKNFYDGIKSAGKCYDGGPDSWSYCGDHLDSDGVIYIQGTGGQFANMDIDCDGTQGGAGDDGRCGSSSDTQSQTSFEDTVAAYNKGIKDLNANVHPYVVFGNTGKKPGYANFDPQSHGIEPLSLMAVIYGIWGDENGDDGAHPMVGEASISLATECFGKSVNGNSGHDKNDVLYIAFTGSDAVPGADGADWGAKDTDTFAKSIQSFGDKLVQRIGASGGNGNPTGTAPSSTTSSSSTKPTSSTCSWSGHCAVQEIQSIKQSVGDRPIPQQPNLISSTPFKDPAIPRLGMPSPGLSRPSISTSSNHPTVSTTQTPGPTFAIETNVEPSLPRALGNQPFSGEDIDYYFQKYFENFHPYMPIVRHRDPNKLYESGSVLFWTIVMVACRRYARNSTVFPFLMDAVRSELFLVISKLPLSIHSINALILVSTWVFTDVRFLNDPTSIFSGVTMNAAQLLGIHSGKGSHPEYSVGMFQNNFSDEEAHFTWAGYCITSQRMAEYRGLPPVGSVFNQSVQNVIDGNTPFHVPGSFRVLLECQKFANRVSSTMTACLDETRGVSSHVVRHLEDEFDHIRGLICSERADDLDRWNALLVQLEIQTYYLIPLPGYNPESLKRNVLRAYTTARTVVQVALELERSHSFLKHMPHFYFRSLISANCIIYKVLRSSYMDFLDRTQTEQTAIDVIEACRQSVVTEGDLPTRLATLLESIWNWNQLARWHEEPISVFTHRLGASVIFDCLKRWKNDMDSRPKSQPPAAVGGETPATLLVPDPMASIDWSFMDDFDWNMEPTLLGPGIAPGIAP
ncbi:hypothetical protein SCUP515_02760 [Seiridium cupressi]